jgi:hypothetical protein
MPINQILRRANSFDEGAARRARAYLERLHAELTQRLIQNIGDKWELQQYEAVRREATQMLLEIERTLEGDLRDVIAGAGEIGQQIADESFKGVIDLFNFPRLSFSFIQEALGASATLVKGITDSIRANIDREIDQGIQGLKTGIQVIRAIADVKDFTGIAFKSAMDRAESIFRTEASRIINLATIERYRQYEQQSDEEILKYWLATNDSRTRETHERIWRETDPAQGGKPIPFQKDFKLSDGERGFGPQAPTFSAENVINCRCRLLVITKKKYLEMKG